jgi:hypothetical protein
MIGMAIDGTASFLYSRASDVALYLDPLVVVNDLAKLSGTLIFLLGFPGLYAFQATRAGGLGLAGFILSFAGLALLEIGTDPLFGFVGPVLANHQETWFLLRGDMEANLGVGFLVYLVLSYLIVVSGFICFGIATFQARIYPQWTGPVIAIGSVAAIVLAPLVSVPTGPFRFDRIGVVAASFAFAFCGWQLLRHPDIGGDARPAATDGSTPDGAVMPSLPVTEANTGQSRKDGNPG